jgi:cytochrome c oxidase cbb3-type subunit IV
MTLDSTTVQIVWTVASFIVFLAILMWAWSKGAKRGFDQAARLPFSDETGDETGGSAGAQARMGAGMNTGSGR